MGTTDSITFNRILTTAASWHASDVHFIIGSGPIVRVDGKLSTLDNEPIINAEFMEALTATILTDGQRQELTKQKEIVAAYSLNPQLRFKITAFYQRGSLSVSFHLIAAKLHRLAELGLPPAVQNFSRLTKGLVLITGPYGSGKTTTLNALVNEINEQRAANVVTIEQPIEYLFVNNKSVIEQREVGRDALSFEQAITAATREDVDVIVVAEANSTGVITGLLDAAEASRLVISTMPTESVLASIEKILNSYPADEQPKVRVQLANVLTGIVSQRLLPKVGGGLVLVAEVMVPTAPIRAVIRDGALFQLTNVLQTSREAGLVSFDRGLAKLVQDGVILLDDALLYAQDPAYVKSLSR